MRPCSRWSLSASATRCEPMRGCRWAGVASRAVPRPSRRRSCCGRIPSSCQNRGSTRATLTTPSPPAPSMRSAGTSACATLRRGARQHQHEAIGLSPAGKPDVFPEALLSHHLKAAGVEVLQTHFHKGDAGLWEMGNCSTSCRRRGGARRSAAAARQRGGAEGVATSSRPSSRPGDDCSATLVEQHSISPCVGHQLWLQAAAAKADSGEAVPRRFAASAGRRCAATAGSTTPPPTSHVPLQRRRRPSAARARTGEHGVAGGGTPPPRVAVCMAGPRARSRGRTCATRSLGCCGRSAARASTSSHR